MKRVICLAGAALLLATSGCEVGGGYGGVYGGVSGEYPSAYYGPEAYPAYPAPTYVYPYSYRVPYDRDHYWDRHRYWERHRWHADHDRDWH